jgi:hypothetical protein
MVLGLGGMEVEEMKGSQFVRAVLLVENLDFSFPFGGKFSTYRPENCESSNANTNYD